jgi:nucleoside-diphosphate-sugar epimerase
MQRAQREILGQRANPIRGSPLRILVIGGTGFIGPYVVHALVERGHEVTVLHRGSTAVELPAGVQHLHGDRADLAAHGQVFERLAPKVVLHMVPMSGNDAEVAVRTFAGLASRLVVISSADVYRARNRLFRVEPGPPDPVPLTEESPLRSALYPYRATTPGPEHPLYHYDKIPVERIVMGNPALPGTVLRLPFVYGPGDRQHRLYEHLRRMDDGRPAIPIREDYAGWRCTRGYVENMAAAIVLALSNKVAAGRIYNVGDGASFTEADWIRRVGEAARWKGDVVPVPEALLTGFPPLAPEQDLVLDTSRIRRELGYRDVVPLETGLQRTVAWERSHPPEPAPAAPDYAAEDRALEQVG